MRAEQRLAEAERELERLPCFGRGRRRDELRTEIALQRRTIEMTVRKLRWLEREPVAEARRRWPQRPTDERPLEPEPVQLDLGL